MNPRWRWGVALALALLAGCAPARRPPSFVPPPNPRPPPTALVVMRLVNVTRTPMPTRPAAGLPAEAAWGGPAQCAGPAEAPVGAGAFAWPADAHFLSGYDYSAGHPGLDLAAGAGTFIYAADAGAVVYAGWNDQGYGNLVILDHGNGWHTLYAHLSQVNVGCGQTVQQGEVIGLGGSTGHSTGPHLHFEMRGPGGSVNPWDYLP